MCCQKRKYKKFKLIQTGIYFYELKYKKFKLIQTGIYFYELKYKKFKLIQTGIYFYEFIKNFDNKIITFVMTQPHTRLKTGPDSNREQHNSVAKILSSPFVAERLNLTVIQSEGEYKSH